MWSAPPFPSPRRCSRSVGREATHEPSTLARRPPRAV
ncbi:hypothetical protein F6B41_25485 [Microbacterium lushaniae]|nr:hypothetical protein F6B41_33855 [Microbacterium lushaniae]KAA9149507.1 hypothetical protein F6B41_25485 [Microbacterium lushaniae]